MRKMVRPGIILLLALTASALWPRPEGVGAIGAASVIAGRESTCALGGGDIVKCWGANSNGELGFPTAETCLDGSNVIPCRTTPANVSVLDTGVVAIAAGGRHICALTVQGGATCWGNNTDGQLGDGSTADRSAAVDVSGLATGVAAISLGNAHSCAVTTEGGVKCWGRNLEGQVGDGTSGQTATPRPAPQDVVSLNNDVVAVTAGSSHTCALTTKGGVKCWGRNFEGQLGNGATSPLDQPSTTPVDVLDQNGDPLVGVAAIASGYLHTCALTTGGGVKCWGKNEDGQLGNTTIFNQPTPVDVCSDSFCVSNLTGVAAIAAGGAHTCALMITGEMKCWGRGFEGQLGDGTTRAGGRYPADVCRSGFASICSPLDMVAAITAGGQHTCAVSTAGGVQCWGSNNAGQLGDGTTANSSNPVDVVGLGGGDSDKDGCTDEQELAGSPTLGGQRDPNRFWDFYDVPAPERDRRVNIIDVAAIVLRFGTVSDPLTKEEAFAQAFVPPEDLTSYHAAFDRGGPIPGENLWDLLPPNGSINVIDIGASIIQFGHTCA